MLEVDYRGLRVLLEKAAGGEVHRRRLLAKFDAAWKEGRMRLPADETPEQRWRRCEARFYLGEYGDWRGWEGRDPWAMRMWMENPFEGLVNAPIWDPSGPRVRRVYLLGEQGLGDEVMFGQVVPECVTLCDEVVVETQPRLMNVFERCWGVKCVAADIGADGIRRAKGFDADAWSNIGDLLRVFRRGTFPRKTYLSAPPDPRYTGRVAVSWRGKQGEIRELPRLVRRVFDCEPLSVQYDQEWDEETERAEVDLTQDLGGIMSVLAGCSRLVTVSTTVAHFAAAMGVRTDVVMADPKTGVRGSLLPWRWVNRKLVNQTPWYGPHVRTYENLAQYHALKGWNIP